MTDITDAAVAAEKKKSRSFRKYTYRGVELSQLLSLQPEELMNIMPARIRRKMKRGLSGKYTRFVKKLRTAIKEAPVNEKPKAVKTHLRDMVILPEMTGSLIAIYNGKTFNKVEIRPEMIGHYLGEYSITYKPVQHKKVAAKKK